MTISRLHTFVAGEVPTAAEWNADIDQLIATLNGGLDSSYITLSGATGLCDLSSAQTLSGRKTFTGGVVINEILSVAAAAAGLVKLGEFRYDPASGTSTDNDGFYISLMGDDDAATPNETEYGRWGVRFTDTGDASEDGELFWGVMTAGSLATELWLSGAALYPNANDGLALGVSGTAFADLFLASGAVINFNAGDVTITHAANALALAGASSGYTVDAVLSPATNDAAALGTTALGWADLHLATGGVINWANGEVTLTETDANTLTVAGISTLALPSGVVLNFASSDVTLTHSTGLLTFAGTGIVLGDDDTIGLGSGKATIEFDDQAPDEINFLNCRLGIGTSTPLNTVDIGGGQNLGCTLMVRGATGPITSMEATANTTGILNLQFISLTPDNNTQGFLTCSDATATRLQIWSDGDVQNHDNSYGALSDAALKQDISTARDYWEDWKQLQFRKYRFITDVEADPNAGYQIGVVAQELETVFPGLVQTNPEDGMKGVKYSVLDVIACKVLQECIERIEALEAA